MAAINGEGRKRRRRRKKGEREGGGRREKEEKEEEEGRKRRRRRKKVERGGGGGRREKEEKEEEEGRKRRRRRKKGERGGGRREKEEEEEEEGRKRRRRRKKGERGGGGGRREKEEERFADFDLSTIEFEQILGQGEMEEMHHAPDYMQYGVTQNGGLYHGMLHDSARPSHPMINGPTLHNMAPPVMPVSAPPPVESIPRPHSHSQGAAGTEPWVEITEQPRQRGLRFRYQCEGRSAGSIPGETSTIENKTFPTIKIHNYRGQAIIVVSCVTKDQPPRCKPHPHSLVGKDCKKGVCTVKVKDANVISFPQLGIQCAKKKDVDGALVLRKEINVDPYQTGFEHASSNIDLNMVRLCFQVFLPDTNGKVTRVVPPVVSEPIQDKKAQNDLVICRVDKTSGKARGGDEVFLLCEKVGKDDIKVRFYEEDKEETVWQAFGDFGQGDVHRQYAIVFKIPKYKEEFITRPVDVNMQLYRPSNKQGSDPIKFTYMPEDPDPDRIEEKRKRKGNWLNKMMPSSSSSEGPSSSSSSVKESLRHMLKANRRIKQEQKADCSQAAGAQGVSMSSQGSESSLEPISASSSLPQSLRTSSTAATNTAPITQQAFPPTTSADASRLVQQFVLQQHLMSGGAQVSGSGGQTSMASAASGNSQPVSLDESFLNLVTMPTSTILSNFDMNALQSFMEFSSGDGGSNNMAEVSVSQDGNVGGGNPQDAGDLTQQQQQQQQQTDFLEVQAALESLNQS
ncbi:hypothetical protein ACOMHN_052201 [Nucella lapillus]